MIKGLRWSNVRWLTLFTLLLIMTASAERAYRLNWGIVSTAYSKLQSGWQGAEKASVDAAKKLDTETQQRYGYDPFELRATNCVTTPNPESNRLALATLVKLQSVRDKASLVAIVGEPYCKEASGDEIWLVDSTKVLKVSQPFKYQLIEVSHANSNPGS